MMEEVIIYTSEPKLITSHQTTNHQSQNYSSVTK